MEFITENVINTTTQISVTSNTISAEYLFSRDETRQYVTEGFDDDATTASIVFSFDETVSVSRLALVGINLKSFTIFYNGSTANTFSIPSGSTTTTNWSTNSETAMYIVCNTASVTKITIDMKTTISANAEKAIGYFLAADSKLDFSRLPSAKNYKPMIDSKEVVHKMSDGSTRIQVIDRKYSADIKLNYITESFRNSLKTVYDEMTNMVFVPFGTMTSWDKIIFPCVWEGPFNFYKFSNDSPNAGFEGSMKIKETSF